MCSDQYIRGTSFEDAEGCLKPYLRLQNWSKVPRRDKSGDGGRDHTEVKEKDGKGVI